MSDFETLRYEVQGGLARLTLDRPDAMNGMTNRMVREATDALELAAADSSVRVLVLTGEGRLHSAQIEFSVRAPRQNQF